MEARGVPTNAKPEEKASELANAELDAQKRTIIYTPIARYCAPGSSYCRSIGPYPRRGGSEGIEVMDLAAIAAKERRRCWHYKAEETPQ
ncbi:hypothetical protein QJS10_CPB14g01357 [Acorus calamus]|uniref:Uncharacterized protein n=1 Tax=Acorus calamus TaxID=4465 RepID=A0AAV9D978_ACOCL|nr:hypothetical protein QJS10_CPB14g01357 [Acorus calamus]